MHHRAAWFRAPVRRRALLLASILGVAALALDASPGTAGPEFQSPGVAAYVPPQLREAVVEDFDGDGILDIATISNFAGGFVTLVRGVGQGRFVPLDSLAIPAPYALAVADLDIDGDFDLIIQGSSRTYVCVGTGGFNFGPPVEYSTGSPGEFTPGVVVANLIGDSNLDVVAADTVGAYVIWRGTGGGSLVVADRLAFAGSPRGLRLADLDHDGDLDLAGQEIEGAAFRVRVFLNTGGAFAPGIAYPAGSLPGFEIGDLDGDGDLDALSGETWLHGNGDGSFDAPALYAGVDDSWPRLGDLNGDGMLDLFTTSSNEDYPQLPFTNFSILTRVRLGAGAGAWGPMRTWATGLFPIDFDVADLNGDGRQDLLVSGFGSGQLTTLLGDGLGGFAPTRSFDAGGEPQDVEIADLTEDGVPDVIALCPGSAELRIFRGLGGGALGSPQGHLVGAAANRMAIGDFDADGHLDVATVAQQLTILPGDGAGGLGSPVSYPLPMDGLSISAGDATGDGIADVLSGGATKVSLYPGQAGAGLGTRVDLNFAIGYRSWARAADVTGDGRADIVAGIVKGAEPASSDAWVWPGQPGGTFGAPVVTPLGSISTTGGIWDGEWADTDGDGKLDFQVVYGDYTLSRVRRARGNGDGTFAPFVTHFPMGKDGVALESADLDGDGRIDLVIGGRFSGSAIVCMSQPDGSFAAPRGYTTTGYVQDVAAGDLDGDGRTDLVTADEFPQTVTVLLQTIGGPLAVPKPTASAGGLALRRIWPSVSSEVFQLDFALPARGEVTVELYDVAGRRLASRGLGVLEAGPHERSFAIDAAVPAGVVWLRLGQGGASAVAKAVVAR